MKDRKLASRYARAMFDVVSEPGTLERVDSFLSSLAESMSVSREIRDFLLDPAVGQADRKKLMDALCDQHQLPAEARRFLHLVIDQGRTAALPSIAEVFHELREEAMGIVTAEMTTATPLADDMKQRAQSALEKMTQKRVRLECSVDPELIGGAVTRIGTKIYDGSLRTQLGELRRKMAEE